MAITSQCHVCIQDLGGGVLDQVVVRVCRFGVLRREQVAQLQLHDSKMFQTSPHGQPGLSWCVAAGTVAPKSDGRRTAATKVAVDCLQDGGQGRDCTPSWLGSYASIRHAPHPGRRILTDDLWQGGAAQLLQPQPPTKALSMLMLLCGDGVKFAFHVHWL